MTSNSIHFRQKTCLKNKLKSFAFVRGYLRTALKKLIFYLKANYLLSFEKYKIRNSNCFFKITQRKLILFLCLHVKKGKIIKYHNFHLIIRLATQKIVLFCPFTSLLVPPSCVSVFKRREILLF